MIYQPEPHHPAKRSARRQAIRRNHSELHWRERPVRAHWPRRLERWLESLQAKLLGFLPERSFSGVAVATLTLLAAAIVLPVSASMVNPPNISSLSLPLMLPPISDAEMRETSSTVPDLASDLYVAGVNDELWQVETVRRNETVGDIFARLKVSPTELHRVLNFSAQTQELARVFPGEQIAFRLKDGVLTGLQFDGDEAHRVLLTWQGDELSQRLIERRIEQRVSYASARIESSLFGAGYQAEMSDALITRLAEVFNFDIDFAQDIQPGDTFSVVYQQVFRDGEKLRDGEILAASFVNQGKRYEIYRYADDELRADYYGADGRSRKKAFIRTPVAFTRISSRFSPNRLHPVLGKMRRHMGVDYATPTGTPIIATGNAVAKVVGWQNGYGNAVILQHRGGIETLYGHMTRFAKGLRRGDKVSQGQVIGYVGMTGLATGPHLHYEFRIKGVHRDPLSVDLPVADPLSGRQMAAFKASTAPLIAQLRLMESTLYASAGGGVKTH